MNGKILRFAQDDRRVGRNGAYPASRAQAIVPYERAAQATWAPYERMAQVSAPYEKSGTARDRSLQKERNGAYPASRAQATVTYERVAQASVSYFAQDDRKAERQDYQ